MSGIPRLVPKPFQVPLCNQNLPPQLTRREAPFPGSTQSGSAWEGLCPPSRSGTLSWQQRGENTTLQTWISPQKYCRSAQTESERAPKLSGSRFIKQASSSSEDLSPKAEPQDKGSFPYIPFTAGFRNVGDAACSIHNHMLFYWLF
jgi:hypothetical protein